MTGKTLPILGFAGYSGSGKTTLLEKLIPLLKKKNIRIGLIKHSHHEIEMDKPTKDSFKLRHAGSDQTLLATRKRHFLMFEYHNAPETREPSLAECIAQLNHSQLDLILVEGFRDAKIPKIEVHRADLGKPLLHPHDPHIIAIARIEHIETARDNPIPTLDLNNPEQILAFILTTFNVTPTH